FDNLIHKVKFSEPFFEPSLGQTQEVSATFAANVDWTLQIINEDSNAVRTVTGSGGDLNYNWNGTGDGGTNIPDGVYHYVITAATNGLALPSSSPPEEGQTNDPPGVSGMSSMVSSGTDSILLPPPPCPPVKIDGQWLSYEDVYGPQPWIEMA